MRSVTPDAAGIVAQVDAGLLIALAIEARSPEKDVKDRDDRNAGNHALLHLIGICAVLLSLSISLASVVYNKPLSGIAEHVTNDSVLLGFFPLVASATDRLMPSLKSQRSRLLLLAILLTGFIWLVIWWASYAPGGLLS